MFDWWQDLGFAQLITRAQLLKMAHAAIILFGGLILARLAAAIVKRMSGRHMHQQGAMVTRRLVYYALVFLTFAITLHQLGFNLGVLLGAAGVLTVALGFASQTSASNLISGLFLLAERPFVVGDLITVDGQTGFVLSVDLLSVKLRTFDNLMVRVPNESIIKAQVVNLTRFPIRRIDLQIGVAYKEDLEKVRDILMDVADRNPLCLDEPAPVFIFTGFADSALTMQFSIWAVRANFLELRNSMYLEIKNAFDEAGIEIPFPHLTIYTGAETAPFPLTLQK